MTPADHEIARRLFDRATFKRLYGIARKHRYRPGDTIKERHLKDRRFVEDLVNAGASQFQIILLSEMIYESQF